MYDYISIYTYLYIYIYTYSNTNTNNDNSNNNDNNNSHHHNTMMIMRIIINSNDNDNDNDSNTWLPCMSRASSPTWSMISLSERSHLEPWECVRVGRLDNKFKKKEKTNFNNKKTQKDKENMHLTLHTFTPPLSPVG